MVVYDMCGGEEFFEGNEFYVEVGCFVCLENGIVGDDVYIEYVEMFGD